MFAYLDTCILSLQRCVELGKKADSALEQKERAGVQYEERIKELKTLLSQTEAKTLSLQVCISSYIPTQNLIF